MWIQSFTWPIFTLYIIVHLTCGLNLTNFKPQMKIVGGEQATVGQFPYQVSLRSAKYSSTLGHFCGGSIINESVILTAAHCIYGKDPEELYIVAGALKLTDSGQQRKVRSYSYHQLYTDKSYKYDIGIIRLHTPLDLDSFSVQTVGLASSSPEAGTLCTVSGWGLTAEKGDSVPNILRYVNVPVSDFASCQKNYSKYGNVVPGAGMLCAGFSSGGKDACSGDSGGPLVCGGRLAGVVSWGRGCAEPNLPGIYTDVSFYDSWIRTNSGTIITIEYLGLRVFIILGLVVFYLIKVG